VASRTALLRLSWRPPSLKVQGVRGSYYKSKLKLKTNSNEILITSLSVILLQLKLTKLKLEVLKSDFQRKSERYELR